MPARILVADDHEVVRQGIRMILEARPDWEICGEAALYFPRFSPETLADRAMQASQSAEQAVAMRDMGLLRSRDFSWDKHVEQLLQLARTLTKKPCG